LKRYDGISLEASEEWRRSFPLQDWPAEGVREGQNVKKLEEVG